MSGLMSLLWERSIEGYEISEVGNNMTIKPRGLRTEKYDPFRIGSDGNVLFQKFVNLIPPDTNSDKPDKELWLSFANNFGLLFTAGDEEDWHEWNCEIEHLQLAVDMWRNNELKDVVESFRTRRNNYGSVSVNLEFRPGIERPTLRFSPPNLLEALWIQFAESVATDRQIKFCKFCNDPFEFGAGTGRRSTAIYCSTKCQKQDSYNKRKES